MILAIILAQLSSLTSSLLKLTNKIKKEKSWQPNFALFCNSKAAYNVKMSLMRDRIIVVF